MEKSIQGDADVLQPAAKNGKPTTDPKLPPTNGNTIGPKPGLESC